MIRRMTGISACGEDLCHIFGMMCFQNAVNPIAGLLDGPRSGLVFDSLACIQMKKYPRLERYKKKTTKLSTEGWPQKGVATKGA